MKNPRVTPKEQGLLKGAINRVFSRSELRQQALDKAEIKGYFDPERPRVTKWVTCNDCKKPTPRYKADVDHVVPRVPLDTEFKHMDLNEYGDRTWCELELLQVLDETCHNIKSAAEKKIRAKLKKERSKK